jgi:hypothetical protein
MAETLSTFNAYHKYIISISRLSIGSISRYSVAEDSLGIDS